jgi:hypothetical protein
MNLISRHFCRHILTPLGMLAICACALLSLNTVANAGIFSFANVTPLLGPPPPPVGGVFPGSQEPTVLPIVFPEVLNGVVGANGLPVDHNGSVVAVTPATTASIVNPLLIDTVIAPGTRFDSYLFHFDPSSNSSPFYGVASVASVTFDTKIIGVQLLTQNAVGLQKPAATPYVGKLEAGDAAVAANGGPTLAYYPGTNVDRGLEEDFMGIGAGGFQIMLQGIALGSEIDQVRIIVEAVPEPTTFAMATMGLLGLFFSCITRMERGRRP